MKWEINESAQAEYSEISCSFFTAPTNKCITFRTNDSKALVTSLVVTIYIKEEKSIGIITDIKHTITSENKNLNHVMKAIRKLKYQADATNSREVIDLLKKFQLIDEVIYQKLKLYINYEPPLTQTNKNDCLIM